MSAVLVKNNNDTGYELRTWLPLSAGPGRFLDYDSQPLQPRQSVRERKTATDMNVDFTKGQSYSEGVSAVQLEFDNNIDITKAPPPLESCLFLFRHW